MSYTMQTITTTYFGATVNSYLIQTAQGFILIDTGGTKGRDDVEKAMLEAGCTPQNVLLIALTHGHFDHSDNARYFQKRFGAKIGLHKDDIDMVQRGNMFIQRGIVLQGLMNGVMWLMGLRHYDKFTPDIIFKEGDTLREFGFDATIHHLPGHSRGSVGFLTSDGAYIVGDVFTNFKGKPAMNSLIENKADLVASVEKIKGSGAKRVYVGHGEPFSLPIG